jgi:hypothetical protein
MESDIMDYSFLLLLSISGFVSILFGGKNKDKDQILAKCIQSISLFMLAAGGFYYLEQGNNILTWALKLAPIVILLILIVMYDIKKISPYSYFLITAIYITYYREIGVANSILLIFTTGLWVYYFISNIRKINTE